MKKTIYTLLFSLFAFNLFISSTSADLLPPKDLKMVGYCPKVINLNDYPEIHIIGHIHGPEVSDKDKDFVIENNKCIYALTYKFNNIDLYWNQKENMDIEDDKLLIKNLKRSYELVKKNNPLKRVTQEYVIKKNEDGTYSLNPLEEKKEFETKKDETKPKKKIYHSKPVVKNIAEKNNHDAEIKKDVDIQTKKEVGKKVEQNIEKAEQHFTLWEQIVLFFKNLFS